MMISIAQIFSPTIDEWDSTWSQCPYSTYFHSREWAEIWEGYTAGEIRPDPKMVVFSDGTKSLVPLSSQKIHGGLLKRYHSSPAGTFGGWISSDHLTPAHAVLLGRFLTQKLGSLIWRLNPYDHLVLASHLTPTEHDVTQTLNLEPGFDRIYKRWTKGHRSAVHKAGKAGVLVRVASTLDDWSAYYRVYQESLRRWGAKATSRYAWPIFHLMCQRSSPNINLWLATYEDVVVAGALIFHAKDHVVYWHGASLEAYLHLRPVHLVLYHAIKAACESGRSWFDFNPSGGHPGVRAFKASFGTEVLSCPLICRESSSIQYIQYVRDALRL
jgi:hypothetical protein